MRFKKAFRFILYFIASLAGVLILFVLVSVIQVVRSPYDKQEFYNQMQQNLEVLDQKTIPVPRSNFKVGFAKENLTPPYPTSTAGYGKRRGALFTAVHDSIYVRTMVISNGTEKLALVTADMLIIPPVVTAILQKKLRAIGFDLDNTYLSATHTHNSIGNWGERLIGEIYAGSYDDSLVHFIADRIVRCISKADSVLVPSVLKAGVIPVTNAVNNRLADKEGTVDSLLRVVEVRRADSTKLVLTSFTAHATCLYSRDLELSRDYPGKLVDELEARGYTFAMFMAGAVGSHGCKGPVDGWEKIDYLGQHIAHTFLDRRDSLKPVSDSTLVMYRVPLALGDPQVKISKDWRVRPWLFRSLFGEYPAFLTVLRLGDVVMLGTPCDFSGELMPPIDSAANSHNLRAMVTSFNGGYIGYITLDKHYDRNHYETRIMNWFGPGNGAYLSESMIRLISEVSDR